VNLHFHYRLKFEEDRLIAIRADGFTIPFIKVEDQNVQTATVFFPFGETTEARVLGWEVSGKFRQPAGKDQD